MFTARWWERRGLQVGLLCLAVGTTIVLRQTQGALLMEAYQGITRPLQMLQAAPNKEERLRDARILELKTEIAELQFQNQKLKQIVSYTEKEVAKERSVVARVIGRSADNWWQQVTLNRGTSAGVQEGSIVKAEGGLVGLVDQVSANSSRVLLVSDLKSQIGVNVSQSAAKGVLKGDGSAEAILEFYEKVPNAKVGDTIATSNYSRKFPAGVAIGKIKSLDLKRVPASVAKIELFPPIRSLDWVQIYPKPETQVETPEVTDSQTNSETKSQNQQSEKPAN
ncbi:rod shape-determining protein MreC [Brunnivagina elsteri]|uniref:Cell shape-determining protein MreC n=1 Tax=Brunnivagina elsteri CCALA 953 TaxID=987040 RepID=A0A2A2TDR5_9CYAN|nr:rod shape-determining protein MreC [Calothrix elsteri]PAX51863.1 rod shape-determining protein MreC [Calothrix elsteri CCALA 953]